MDLTTNPPLPLNLDNQFVGGFDPIQAASPDLGYEVILPIKQALRPIRLRSSDVFDFHNATRRHSTIGTSALLNSNARWD
jgi:hypothetical protein